MNVLIINTPYTHNHDGGDGSGNWGHEGVIGQWGGSAPGGGAKYRTGERGSYKQSQRNSAKSKTEDPATIFKRLQKAELDMVNGKKELERIRKKYGKKSKEFSDKTAELQKLSDSTLADRKALAKPLADIDADGNKVSAGTPMSFFEADNTKANPNFKTGGKDYTINCQSCVVAFEARIRGYDVEAKAFHQTNGVAKKLAYDTASAWKGSSGNVYNRMKSRVHGLKNGDDVFNHLDATLKDGERYHIGFQWKGKGNGGHIITAQKINGEVVLYDPQADRTCIGKQSVTKFLSNIHAPSTELLRVDNLQFNEARTAFVLTKSK